jgi:hypothetical protein
MPTPAEKNKGAKVIIFIHGGLGLNLGSPGKAGQIETECYEYTNYL